VEETPWFASLLEPRKKTREIWMSLECPFIGGMRRWGTK
jgi:hypothetical protein